MPLMRTPQAAGAGEGLGGHRGSHKLPTPGGLRKGTLGTQNGKDREGTARRGTAEDTGAQPWASPLPSAPQFPHHRPMGPENPMVTQASTIRNLCSWPLKGKCGLPVGLEEKEYQHPSPLSLFFG